MRRLRVVSVVRWWLSVASKNCARASTLAPAHPVHTNPVKAAFFRLGRGRTDGRRANVPCRTRTRETPTWPPYRARCSGVLPRWSSVSRPVEAVPNMPMEPRVVAPSSAATRYSTTCTCPLALAACSGVHPRSSYGVSGGVDEGTGQGRAAAKACWSQQCARRWAGGPGGGRRGQQTRALRPSASGSALRDARLPVSAAIRSGERPLVSPIEVDAPSRSSSRMPWSESTVDSGAPRSGGTTDRERWRGRRRARKRERKGDARCAAMCMGVSCLPFLALRFAPAADTASKRRKSEPCQSGF